MGQVKSVSDGSTIFALATAPGRAGIAVIRVSGPLAWSAAEVLSGPLPQPRVMALRTFRSDGADLDQGLIVVFEGSSSFTGEAQAEFQIHGGRATVGALLGALERLDGLRPAGPGEFTRRALDNGRLSPQQVEGLIDLIDAETEMQRRQAMNIVGGDAVEVVRGWRRDLITALGLIEASIDFADEEDAPVSVDDQVSDIIGDIRYSLRDAISAISLGEKIKEGFEVVLVGPPNVGKSSLLNLIAGREVAIVSERAGTTRDLIEVRCDLNGLPVTFVDMAGIRDTDDEVEKIGVERALARADGADMRLLLRSWDTGDDAPTSYQREIDMIVATKSDVGRVDGDIQVTVKERASVDRLLAEVRRRLTPVTQASVIAANQRQAAEFAAAADLLDDALTEAEGEVKAHLVRAASIKLSAVVDGVAPDEVLDEVFSRYCIGK